MSIFIFIVFINIAGYPFILLSFPRVPKVIDLILLSPILIVISLIALFFVTCEAEMYPTAQDSLIRELTKVERDGYSVHLLRDCEAPATVACTVEVEQRLQLLPGLYLRRTIDSFYGANSGNLTLAGSGAIRLQLPDDHAVGRYKDIDQIYPLNRHVYF